MSSASKSERATLLPRAKRTLEILADYDKIEGYQYRLGLLIRVASSRSARFRRLRRFDLRAVKVVLLSVRGAVKVFLCMGASEHEGHREGQWHCVAFKEGLSSASIYNVSNMLCDKVAGSSILATISIL